jgi:Na+/phosphate symporter
LFSEEKKQKTFIPAPVPRYQAMAGWHTSAERQKFFASFFQKRSSSLLSTSSGFAWIAYSSAAAARCTATS